MAEESSRPIRLMNFVSEEQLDEVKKTRGERVEDGTAQRDRPLFEILKENKDKQDAEFNERFKHRPPKALDEDETEFLEKLEMSRREYDQQIADEEAQELLRFQAALAAQSNIVHELKETPPAGPAPIVQEQKSVGRKNRPARPFDMIIKVKPHAKKAKLDPGASKELSDVVKVPTEKILEPVATTNRNTDDVGKISLVLYSDESEEDE
ncbi:uncharacterized protein LOC121263331 [Juglans microcarpa x Juglans regia]|uniref:uncharacterized protein LOC121263331 n=1 Tax=Juglans microcarpa x Juglans regia TaxID=2249226 RepID=UPI001B7F29CF|nr:uncharacterized protein LOC121263331 [Juglans microcarpa x Juglans regia]XP_041022099.1 uncharacterized protein LOC121263331 [Juglans microcarpa x Juglans regia]XP_041022100.1 uncharacterized protein LOC121263331 [Juglans microcarpa x Juglans regia]